MTALAHAMSEDELLDAVVRFAVWNRWLVDHPRPARTKEGWRTALRGHPGRPDLFLVHPIGRVVTAELKSENGRLSDGQKAWDRALAAAAQRAAMTAGSPTLAFAHYVWRPSDWLSGHIREVLAR